MKLDLSTPAVLFPAISLLLLAYTNRFLHLASLIRKLHAEFLEGHDPMARAQIENLRVRLRLIRYMQASGVASLLGCTLSMTALFFSWSNTGAMLFAASVIIMAWSLALSLREILISGDALAILLSQLESGKTPAP